MRFFYALIFVVWFLFLEACNGSSDQKTIALPYSKEKIINILSDIHFAKSAANIYNDETKDSVYLVYESQVLAIHGISKEAFDSLVLLLESDLETYYEIEKEVYTYLKTVQDDQK